MVIERRPFYRMLTEEEREALEKEKGTTFTVRVNSHEWAILQEAKTIMDIEGDSTAVKALVEMGLNVLHSQLSGPTLARLFKKDRKTRKY